MEAGERCEWLRKHSVQSCLDVGKEVRAPFPVIVDNTMRSSFRKCPRSMYLEHILCRSMGSSNIHLLAGGAYAEGMDAFRKSYYIKSTEVYRKYEAALDAGLYALIKHYGFDEARESSVEWAASPKSCERMIAAFLDYWEEYHPKLARSKMVYYKGQPASELGGILPLGVMHPVTGEPLKYSFRFDYVEDRGGAIWLGDDKTTSSLGQSWSNQWPLRSQFLGYVYAARKILGLEAVGVIARGTGILKTSIKHMEVPVSVREHLSDRWWTQVNKDFQCMVDNWQSQQWEYDFADGCAAYGGCKFQGACGSKFEHKLLASMPIRVWNPSDPENSPTVRIEDL